MKLLNNIPTRCLPLHLLDGAMAQAETGSLSVAVHFKAGQDPEMAGQRY